MNKATPIDANERAEENVPWRTPRAAYVHIPFCAHHCGYCDFAVAVGQDARIGAYLDALESEMGRLGTPVSVSTLFLGGGTPSHLDLKQQQRLFGILQHWLKLEEGAEVSLEANPDDVTDDKARLWAERGVTRLSLGAQSFQPALLAVLERRHRVEQVPATVEVARRHGLQIGLDLIFGVPGQTLADWLADLERALTLTPDHVSTYGLTFEKGTRLWKQQAAGAVHAIDEEVELALYLAAKDRLQAAGFEHYEISNFARPGRRCRHNLVYWANEAYWGFGMGAASYVQGVRRLNTRDLATYLNRAAAGAPCHFQEEELPQRKRAFETIATQLRRLDGIDRAAFARQTGFALDDLLVDSLARLVDLGLLDDDGLSVRLSRAGLPVADRVVQEIFGGAGVSFDDS